MRKKEGGHTISALLNLTSIHLLSLSLFFSSPFSPYLQVIPSFMLQGGDFTHGNGMGGESIYGYVGWGKETKRVNGGKAHFFLGFLR